MKISTLHDILNSGKKPIVRFGKGFGESIDCSEAIPTEGMVAKIIQYSAQDGSLICFFDLSIAKEHNISLMGTDWPLDRDPNSGLCTKFGNPLEAGMIGETLLDSYSFDLSDDVDFPLEILEEDSPLAHYLNVVKKDPTYSVPYLEWLEQEWLYSNVYTKQMVTF